MKHPVFATAACPATALALALIELPLHGVTVHTVLDSPCPELIDQMENSGPHWVLTISKNAKYEKKTCHR